MFKLVKPQLVQDLELGISLEATGMHSFRYRNNNYSVDITSEPLNKNGEYAVCMYLSQLQTWDFPDQDLTVDEKKEIKNNILNASKVMNLEVEIE